MQDDARHRKTMQDNARQCKMLQDGVRECGAMQDDARWCKMMQDKAIWLKVVQDDARWCIVSKIKRNGLFHTLHHGTGLILYLKEQMLCIGLCVEHERPSGNGPPFLGPFALWYWAWSCALLQFFSISIATMFVHLCLQLRSSTASWYRAYFVSQRADALHWIVRWTWTALRKWAAISGAICTMVLSLVLCDFLAFPLQLTMFAHLCLQLRSPSGAALCERLCVKVLVEASVCKSVCVWKCLHVNVPVCKRPCV